MEDENSYRSQMEKRRASPAEVVIQPDLPHRSGNMPHCTTSNQLLGAASELVIMHAGRQYRLRLTQNGKLILTA